RDDRRIDTRIGWWMDMTTGVVDRVRAVVVAPVRRRRIVTVVVLGTGQRHLVSVRACRRVRCVAVVVLRRAVIRAGVGGGVVGVGVGLGVVGRRRVVVHRDLGGAVRVPGPRGDQLMIMLVIVGVPIGEDR